VKVTSKSVCANSPRLDGLKKAFWLVDKNCGGQFSIVAEIEGRVAVEMWASALHEIGRRSVLLASQILVDCDGSPFFAVGPRRGVPLAWVCGGLDQWTSHVAVEQEMRFDVARDPLIRARLLHDVERSILILTFHHTIADGESAGCLLRDVLRAVSGSPGDASIARAGRYGR
jgi:hypothetical protein